MAQKLSNYNYSYPPELVAQSPLAERGASRMMALTRSDETIRHHRFFELFSLLNSGDLLVVNDTSVLPSRLFARKPTGGSVEILLVRRLEGGQWAALLSPIRGLQVGMRLNIFSRELQASTDFAVTLVSLEPEDFRICFDTKEEEDKVLSMHGEMPLPPYIGRSKPNDEDRRRYQTCFAKNPGAVAAPTAGLHFSEDFKKKLEAEGVGWSAVTLHVGPGTFLPVRVEDIEAHRMHTEWYEIPQLTLEKIEACKAGGGKVTAVGTTSLRALETWARSGETRGWTDLFVRPGFEFRIVDRLLTNFHQPRSTLLMLVSAFAGRKFILRAYEEAIRERYRLFSYGDCMLIL